MRRFVLFSQHLQSKEIIKQTNEKLKELMLRLSIMCFLNLSFVFFSSIPCFKNKSLKYLYNTIINIPFSLSLTVKLRIQWTASDE